MKCVRQAKCVVAAVYCMPKMLVAAVLDEMPSGLVLIFWLISHSLAALVSFAAGLNVYHATEG